MLASREELSLKSSSLKKHMQSDKLEAGKKRLESKETREHDIAQALVEYNSEEHMKGETLPPEVQVYRVKVVSAFLRAAVPLSKLECFRDLLEENGHKLSDRRHMSDLIPFVLKQEQACLRKEIEGKHVAIIFDGTTRLGEVLAVVLRFVTDDFVIQQRLIRLQLLAKSATGEEIARELVAVLSVGYEINPSLLLSAMRDGASTNNVAMRTLSVVYVNLFDVACFSHALDRVDSHFSTPILSEFINAWISLFTHSPKVKLLWRERTGMSMASYSNTRWWSKWEMMHQVFHYFGEVEPFLLENEDMPRATRGRLLGFFSDASKKVILQVQLAAIVDYGEPFVKGIYN